MTETRRATPAVELRTTLIGASVAVALAWIVVLLAWGEAPFALTFDDAYYYFGIARNVVDGHGSTFDQLNETNGYHPMWLALSIPAYALGLDGLAAARALLVLQVLLYGAALVVVADSVGRAVGRWPAVTRTRPGAARSCNLVVTALFVVVVANPFVVKVFVNGLESAVVVVVDALVLWVAARRLPAAPASWADGTAGGRLAFGALLALAFLARTDAVILVGCFGLWVLLESWPLGATRVRALVELFGPVAVTAAVYLALNEAAFGTPVQVSGLVKRAPLDGGRMLVAAAFGAAAAAIFAATFRARRRSVDRNRLPLVVSFLRRTGWFAAFSVLLVGYYSVLQTQQWLWYYAPVVLYGMWALLLLAADMISSTVVEAPAERSVGRTIAPVAVLLLAPFVVAAALQARVFADPDLRSIQLANRDAGEWIAANLPPDAVLASWDAGVVGYFAERPVINLDGVVNSLEWHEANEQGRAAAFLREDDLGWIVNHGTDVGGRDPEIESFLRSQFGPDVAASASVEETWPFVFSGVTAGSAGTAAPGDAPQAVFLYRLPPLP